MVRAAFAVGGRNAKRTAKRAVASAGQTGCRCGAVLAVAEIRCGRRGSAAVEDDIRDPSPVLGAVVVAARASVASSVLTVQKAPVAFDMRR